MGYWCKTKVDISSLTKIPKVGIVKLFAQVFYDGYQGTETANNVFLDKTSSIRLSYLGKGLCFHPPSKVVYGYYGVLGLTRSSKKWPDQV